jgi:hypothetical protein
MYKSTLTYLSFLIFLTFQINAGNSNLSNQNASETTSSTIQRVRIDFTSPSGYIRHLLLGFTPDNAASDGVDYGYDGLNADDFPDDLNWMIENERYVIQGVGAFENTKTYPLGLFLSNSGNIEIKLTAIENFAEDINVFVFDAVLNTYTQINDADYSGYSDSGDYTDRFFITFLDNSSDSEDSETALSIEEHEINNISIFFNSASHELIVKAENDINEINEVTVYDILGRKLQGFEYISQNYYSFPIRTFNSQYIVQVKSKNKIITKKIIVTE